MRDRAQIASMLSFLESKRETEERLNLVDPHLKSNHQPCETACDLVQPFIHLYKDLGNNYGLQNIIESFTPKNGITQHWWRGNLSPSPPQLRHHEANPEAQACKDTNIR
jgi:hypothetical protein